MPLFLPTRNALVEKSLMATSSMWAWMRDLTAAFNGGNGFAPADATYFLRTSDSSLPNARVATNSATITLDYSTPGQVKWDAISTSTIVAGSIVTLTDAQIKAWPSAAIDLVPAQGASTRIAVVMVEWVSDFSAGAYTNIDPTATVYGALSGGETGYTNTLVNDNTIPLTQVDTTFGARDSHISFVPGTLAEPVNAWGNIPFSDAVTAASYNVPFQFVFSNAAAGNLTGGNAANTLTLQAFYIVETF